MMEEMPKKKKASLDLTKKRNVILSIVVGVIAIVIFVLIFNANKGLGAELVINTGVTSENMSSYTFNAGNNTDITIKPNGIVNLRYSYSDGKDYGVKWIVSDESIAKVEGKTLVGLKPGTITIYAVSKKDNKVKSNKVTLTFE
ncbi:MAG: Ig-like domain-containing protein [Bacilli bacterium]|nr:Ig-like domain-containing protein [Bacilli bacterium]